jgi:DNA repair protein RadC
LPCSFLAYHVVLAVKAVRCSLGSPLIDVPLWLPSLRYSAESASPSLDRCAATWTAAVTGQFRPHKTETNVSINLYISDEHTATGYREATLDEIMTGARQALRSRVRTGTVLSSPRMTANYLTARLAQHPYEVFTLIYLDNRHRLIACEDLFRGTIDGATVHPREVVKEALKHNAAAVILAHNHPSGVAEPSQADEQITRRLREALALVDIRVLDHVVVAGGDTTSFAERGLL